MSLFSHSLSPDQLPILCTSFSFASYHVVYGTRAAMSAPTIAFVLMSPVYTDKKKTNRIHPRRHISLCALASHSRSHFALHLHHAPRSHLALLISLSKQYEQKPPYFYISNISHRCELIATHCTDVVPPAAYVSLCNHLLTLCVQVTPFTQHCFNTEQSIRDLGHFQQFRQHLIEPAAIHMQQCSQNLVKPAPPPYYCDDIVVLFIVLYGIRIAAVSHLTHPVTGTTSHMTHRAMRLSSQAASLYSLLFSHSTLLLMCT